ncbi:preprotein translocase subunit SecE [Candidatus Peregrinibacteria bacterium]|nr:preprotein translocase subunit SecE [Candidatus Peregrinibacteria bacterium]
MAKKGESAILTYFQESFQEIKKVTWPTKDQTLKLTLIVLGFCLVISLFIGILDGLFNYGYNELLNYARSIQ